MHERDYLPTSTSKAQVKYITTTLNVQTYADLNKFINTQHQTPYNYEENINIIMNQNLLQVYFDLEPQEAMDNIQQNNYIKQAVYNTDRLDNIEWKWTNVNRYR